MDHPLTGPSWPLDVCLVAAHFAHTVHRKLASSRAFLRSADELRVLGAPAHLVAGHLEAATEAMLHTRMVTELAERFGASPPEPRSKPVTPRTLLQLALDNAVEGCVRATYGALEASIQATSAGDEEVHAVMTTIARDETTHATLAWDLHAWLEDRLSASDWALVERAMATAIDTLSGELGCPRGASLTTLAGLPDEATAVALLEGLRARLWASESVAA